MWILQLLKHSETSSWRRWKSIPLARSSMRLKLGHGGDLCHLYTWYRGGPSKAFQEAQVQSNSARTCKISLTFTHKSARPHLLQTHGLAPGQLLFTEPNLDGIKEVEAWHHDMCVSSM